MIYPKFMNKLQAFAFASALELAACNDDDKDKANGLNTDIQDADADTDTDSDTDTDADSDADTDTTDTGTGVLLGSVSEAVTALLANLDEDGCPTDNSTGLPHQPCVGNAAILVPALTSEIERLAREQTGDDTITMADILADQVPGTVWWQNSVTGPNGDYEHKTEIALAFGPDQTAAFEKDGRNPAVSSIQSTSIRVSDDMISWTPYLDQTRVRSVPEGTYDDLDVKIQDSRAFESDAEAVTPSLEVFAVDYPNLSDPNFNFTPTTDTMNDVHDARAEATRVWTNNASILDSNGGNNFYPYPPKP